MRVVMMRVESFLLAARKMTGGVYRGRAGLARMSACETAPSAWMLSQCCGVAFLDEDEEAREYVEQLDTADAERVKLYVKL